MKNREALYIKAMTKWGEGAQKVAAIEEFSELIQALSRNLNGKADNVEEEMADAWNMLDQLMIMFDSKKVEEWREKKLTRLEAILNGEEDYDI